MIEHYDSDVGRNLVKEICAATARQTHARDREAIEGSAWATHMKPHFDTALVIAGIGATGMQYRIALDAIVNACPECRQAEDEYIDDCDDASCAEIN